MASNSLKRTALLVLAAAAAAGCTSNDRPAPAAQAAARTPPKTYSRDPYPSTYHRYPGVVTAITGATIFDG